VDGVGGVRRVDGVGGVRRGDGVDGGVRVGACLVKNEGDL
jgi:hypothetical protein